jgi:hypothetical protein
VTLTNLELKDESSKSNGAGAGAQIPVDPSLGIDVHARAKYSIRREKGYSAYYEEESIVFMGYRLVRLEKVTGTRAKLGRIFLGQKHGFTIQDGGVSPSGSSLAKSRLSLVIANLFVSYRETITRSSSSDQSKAPRKAS